MKEKSIYKARVTNERHREHKDAGQLLGRQLGSLQQVKMPHFDNVKFINPSRRKLVDPIDVVKE